MKSRKKKLVRAEAVLLLLFLILIVCSLFFDDGEEVSQSAGAGWTKPDDLTHARFVVMTGSAYDAVIRKRFPDAERVYVSTWSDETMLVSLGKADALVRENSSIRILQEEYPDLVPMKEPVWELDAHWCTLKTEKGRKICREVDNFISELQKEDPDILRKIYEKWENPETAPDHVDKYPMTGEYQGKLRIVTSLDWEPVCFQKGNNACGYMIELAERFCAFAGYEPVFEYVDVQSAMAGFEAGRYDLFGYGMEYTEEAAETYYYTVPLLVEPVYIVVRWENYALAQGPASEKASGSAVERFCSRLWASIEKNFIREDRWKLILSGLRVTVLLSVFSAVLGTVLGALICALRMSPRLYPEAFARIYIKVLQGTPIVMLLMILYYIVFGKSDLSAFWVCVLGFSMDFSAYASEIFRSSIEAVPPGQAMAAKALGFKPHRAFIRVVLPQAMIHIVPVYMGQIISTVKLTSVAGYISVEDLTRVSDIIRSRTYEAFFPLIFTAVVYFLVASLLTSLLKLAEKRIDPMQRPRRIKGVVTRDPGPDPSQPVPEQ